MPTAAERWVDDLAAWAIPDQILAAAPESPWGFPAALFAGRAVDAALSRPASPSRRRALESLPEGGTVLDVGSGGGAASLALVPPAGRLVAVDESAELLRSFSEAAGERGVAHREVQGTWPDVSAEVESADVVVCHHVLYNVADLVPFVTALTDHARRRVVVELTARHPLVATRHLWDALHGIERPEGPTARDAEEVLWEAGLDPQREEWERPSPWDGVPREERVAFSRRRLCVGPERDAEIDALLDRGDGSALSQVVTLWWEGRS